MANEKLLKGFARMSPEKRKEFAAKGGASVPNDKRAFNNKELAARAGRKGGSNLADHLRSFSVNKRLAIEAGRIGGKASQAARKARLEANKEYYENS